MNSQTPLKRKTTQYLVASILILSTLAGMLSACNMIVVTPKPAGEIGMELTPTVVNPATQELTLVSPTEVATEIPTLTVTPEPTATMIPTEIATAIPEPTAIETKEPTVAVPTNELGIRTEFAKGEAMTKEELKASVDWFYNLSETELSEITKDNLWSFIFFPNDSRPRDPGDNTKVIRDYEDLGWYYRFQTTSSGCAFGNNGFNGVYLGTVKSFVEGNPSFFVSAVGTKDWLGNRFVLYGITGIQYTDNFAFMLKESEKQNIYGNDGEPISPTDAVYKLLNNNLKEVVNINLLENLTDVTPFIDSLRPGEGISARILMPLEGDNNLMNLIEKQRKGLSTISARELVDSSLNIKLNKLPSKFSLENFNNLVPYMDMMIFKD